MTAVTQPLTPTTPTRPIRGPHPDGPDGRRPCRRSRGRGCREDLLPGPLRGGGHEHLRRRPARLVRLLGHARAGHPCPAGSSDRHPRALRTGVAGTAAVCGILLAHDADDRQDGGRRFELPAAAAEALTDETSLAYLGPLPRMFMAAAQKMPELLDAYRTGDGVSWDKLGADAREAQAALNRPWFERRLGEALRGVPDVDEALAQPGARILDVGCGAGWSTLALARAYPAARVEGVDVDPPSVEMARRNAASAGLEDRVTFRTADAGTLGTETYDAAFAFECVHDMSRPVDVLAAVRRVVRPEGLVVVMDEAVAEELVAPGDDLERFMYACSIFVCLPDGMSSAPSAGTGTVMRSSTLRGYAQRPGSRTWTCCRSRTSASSGSTGCADSGPRGPGSPGRGPGRRRRSTGPLACRARSASRRRDAVATAPRRRSSARRPGRTPGARWPGSAAHPAARLPPRHVPASGAADHAAQRGPLMVQSPASAQCSTTSRNIGTARCGSPWRARTEATDAIAAPAA